MPEPIEFIDSTLRDGEQAPGVWFTPEEKLQLARLLDRTGIDVLDAGFPASSAEDVEVIQELSAAGLRARVAASARPTKVDVAAAERARAQEVFVFHPVSDVRLRGLHIDRSAALARIQAGVEEARGRGLVVNVVAEDACRADVHFLRLLRERLESSTVQRLVICDTIGAATPDTIADLVREVGRGPGLPLSLHCHNDFGLATANTLAGVVAGATSVSGTVNGLGERAGNADLAEVAAALTHLLGRPHHIDPLQLVELSAAVELFSGVHVSPLKPVVGSNVYRHESGIHVHGMLHDPCSYEHLPAAWVGCSSCIVLGKHSGVSSVSHVLKSRDLPFSSSLAERLLAVVKQRSTSRSKAGHASAYRETRRHRQRLLGGLPERVLVELFDSIANRSEEPWLEP